MHVKVNFYISIPQVFVFIWCNIYTHFPDRAEMNVVALRVSSAQEQLCPPSFVMKMRNSRVLEGDGVRLECKVTASPAPQIYWKKDKEMLRIDPRRTRSDIHHALWIQNVAQTIYYIYI